MANEYPWTNKHLFVDQSPLYNADKIHTPLLFVHGTADNNVPVGESIQLYTALKLLGRPTAMVLVDGQDHHIIDYEKRIKWQNTIFAWFAKWLQDDGSKECRHGNSRSSKPCTRPARCLSAGGH
jgi:dipeptidyl aminopeptidase/acylaminoacyl peptidase